MVASDFLFFESTFTVTRRDSADAFDITADVSEFGFLDDNPADKWDFLSTVTTSTVAGLGVGDQLYTTFPNLGSTFVDLLNDFSVDGALSDNRAVVPVPTSMALLLVGLVGIGSRHRRRRSTAN